MFTGIIEDTGTIKSIVSRGDDAMLMITTSMSLSEIKTGDSIAVNGACLTVTELTSNTFTADVSAETLTRTNISSLRAGDRVNLEKALTMTKPLGGHFVLGHVDCKGKICEKKTRSGSVIFGFEIEAPFARYIVSKGSITIDGISLTVNECRGTRFYVNVIPHTAGATTLDSKKEGSYVNIETDILGKYVEKLLSPQKEIDTDFLSKHGFIN